ncbi:putative ribonuclease H-like domain-containing protein [Tanacetum coccineum]
MTPATTTSSSLQNLPNFASLFGFDYRLKALEDNFSELRQTNQYAEALSSIPSTVDQYLANKMQEAVDVAVQLKYDRIREESTTANQQFLDSIDDGMKKIIKEQVKKEVSKIIPKVEKFVTDQLESEVLVRSSKEANTSHAVAANLSELELKKILIDKMEANNSINRSDIQRQLYKALVEAYEADKILLDTYGDTVTIKRPRDGADDDQEPSAGTDRGSKRRRSGKEPDSTSAPSETTTKTAGKTTSTGSKTHTKSASQSAPVGEAMHSTDVFKGPADQEFETGVQDEQAEEEVQHLPDWFQKPTRLPSPDHAWNTSVPAVHESVQPWLSNLAQQEEKKKQQTPRVEVYKATTEKLDWINPEGRQYPHDLRQPLPLVPNSQEYGQYQMDRRLSANSMWSQMIRKYDNSPSGESHIGAKRKDIYAFATLRESARTSIQKDGYYVSLSSNKVDFLRLRNQDLEDMAASLVQEKSNLRRKELNTPIPIQEDSSTRIKTRRQIERIENYTSSANVRRGGNREIMPTEIANTEPNTTRVSYEVSVLSDIEDSHGPSDAMHNPLPATQSQKDFVSKLTEIHSFLLTLSLRNIRVNSFTMKMEILLESTSNKLMVGNGSTVVDPHGSKGKENGGKRFQMSSMGELIFFLGLQVKQKTDGIFISQDKYVADMLKKFDLASVKTAITPMETKMALTKDEEADEVDVHLYRSMIGSLMYLTASRPDIMFAVCACSRFQVTPKTSHLNAVKRIFKYLKGKPNLGLWYPRESSFDLEAYSDSDYAGANLDRKSTTGGCQFLGSRLISWQCKKQTIVATSTTEAEYVAAASCCGQVLWIQNQMLDYGFNFMNTKIHIDNESTICIVKNPVYHSKTKHIEIRHHFIRDSYEKKLIRVEKIHTDFNVADLLTKAFDGPRFNFLVVNIGMINP